MSRELIDGGDPALAAAGRVRAAAQFAPGGSTVHEPLVAAVDAATGGEGRPSRPSRPRAVAVLAGVALATVVGVFAGFTSARSSADEQRARDTHLLVWMQGGGAPTALGEARIQLRVSPAGTGPVDLRTIRLGYTQVSPRGGLELRPRRTSGTAVRVDVDCDGAQRQTRRPVADVSTPDGTTLEVPVVLLPDDTSFRAGLLAQACSDPAPFRPPVRVVAMSATVTGAVDVLLAAEARGQETTVAFTLRPPAGPWLLITTPAEPVLLRPGAPARRVRLELALAWCPPLYFGLPSAERMVSTRTVTSDGTTVAVDLYDWDDTVVGQAAALVLNDTCLTPSSP